MFGNVLEERGLLGSSLATIFDADGRRIDFDVREDDLQNEKLDEVIELLIAAGYFRARIKGISAFDKVVGGMVWCISFCDHDIDVDLLFQENLSIGQKIALTEKIVAVLTEMHCPFALEPHQIQGLDFIHIFPVVQWLVKKTMEAKEETGDAVQSYANYQFQQNFATPANVQSNSGKISGATAFFSPERMYKRSDGKLTLNEVDRIRSTLLEYEGLPMKRQTTSSAGGSEKTAHAKTPRCDVTSETDDHHLATALSKIEPATVSIENALITVVGGEHAKMSADYAKDTVLIVKPKASLEVGQHIATSMLEDEHSKDTVKSFLEVKAKLQEELAEKRSKLQENTAHLNKLKDSELEIIHQTETFESAEKCADPRKVELLKELLDSREEVRKMEAEFKERCKKEANLLEAEKDKLSQIPAINGDEKKFMATLMKKRQDLSKILVESRKSVNFVLREISSFRRKIDEVPSSLELNQYQRRFVELYNEIASLQKEAKKFYILYNTLCDVKNYMEKEIGLLDSVYDTYERGLRTEQVKTQFLHQLEQTFDSIKQMKLRVEKKCNEEKLKRDAAREAYQEMLDRQRFYYKVVSDFREECKKNEVLRASLEESGNEILYENV